MENEFVKLQQKVRDAIQQYYELREELNIKSPGQSRSIEVLARPFLHGHFTLAIIGKMSSGKSTFVNALLEKNDLLATGFGQTTCTLTEIIHSEEERYEVLFADDTIKLFTSIQELQKHMAIPEQYSDLPIKQINDLIVQGKKASDIWEFHDALKEKNGKPIDKDLLNKYCNHHSASNISQKVRVYTQLPQNYQGWKIVDTPGIAAKGGMEDETYKLLNSKDESGRNNTVDAIIFVNSAATQIEDSTFHRFVKETIESLNDSVRERLFLVRTHGADRAYRNNKSQQDSEAQKLFVEGLRINKERIHVVDSLCDIFIRYAEEHKLDLKEISRKAPADWDDKLWQSARDICRDAADEVDGKGREVNFESINNEICSWANFDSLTESLNKFVKKEKEQSFKKIQKLIKQDLTAVRKRLKKNIKTLSKNKGDLAGLQKELDDVKAEGEKLKNEMNNRLSSIRKDFNRDSVNKFFQPISDKVYNLSGDIQKMSSDMRKYITEVEEQKKSLLDNLADLLSSTLQALLENSNIAMPIIDFQAIADTATHEATHEEIVGYEKKVVKASGFWGRFKRFITLGGLGYEEIDDKNKPLKRLSVNPREAIDNFRNQVQIEFEKGLKAFKEQLGRDIDVIGRLTQEELDSEVKINIQITEELTKKCQNEEERQKELHKLNLQFDKIREIINSIK